MDNIPFQRKLVDTIEIAPGGRVDQYWRKEIFDNVFKGKRQLPVTDKFKFYDAYYLLQQFNLKGFEFGNWLNQQDRYTYMAGAAFAMQDLCTIVGMAPSKFGLDKRITLAFGARGHSRTLAHFEPKTFAINLTKHREGGVLFKYLGTSGAGSLGHEYAHALDFLAGRYLDKGSNYNFCSETVQDVFIKYSSEASRNYYRIADKYRMGSDNPYRQAMIDGLGAIMYEKVDSETYRDSQFYYELKQKLKQQPGLGDYWKSIVEIWARSYEVYLSIQCERAGIEESFLKKQKYAGFLYPAKKQFTPTVIRAFGLFTRRVADEAGAVKINSMS